MFDGIRGAKPLKPDLTSHDTRPLAGFKACWTIVVDRLVNRRLLIRVAVEVKNSWSQLLSNIATFARASLSGTPLRTFSMCLGINHIQKEICVFIFHVGGVADSNLVQSQTETGRRPLPWFLLAIMWQNAHDAGEPLLSDGLVYRLPLRTPHADWTDFTLERVLHHRLKLCGRKTFVIRLARQALAANTTSSAILVPEPAISSARGSDSICNGAGSTQVPVRSGARLKRPTEDTLENDENASVLQTLGISSSINGSRPTSSTSGSRQRPSFNQPPPDMRLSHDSTRVLFVPEETAITRAIEHETVPDAVVVKFSWQPAEKARVEIEALQRCSGRFGTPSFLCALRIDDNYEFMPPTSDKLASWSCFKKAERPKGLERRALIATVCADSGASLECCKSPWELGRALLDCQLGWLGLLQCDRLHRDISVGNLLLLDKPVSRPPFESKLPSRYEEQGLGELVGQHEKASQELGDVLVRLGVHAECTAIIMDFDLVARLDSNEGDRGHVSGTKEFMSERMLSHLEYGDPYQQSVVDDLAAFLNVAFWAALFNAGNTGDKIAAEHGWCCDVRSGYKERFYAHGDIVSDRQARTLSGFLGAFRPVLQDWGKYMQGSPVAPPPQPLEDQSGVLRWDLEQQTFAVQSVLAFANILLKHHDNLKAA